MAATKSLSNKKTVGVEFIGDLKKCNNIYLRKLRKEALRKTVSKLIKKYMLTELGSYYHQFDIGVTGVVALAESHITFHTWSEKQYVSLNIFVCNYSTDNTKKAKSLFNELVNLFGSKIIEKKEIVRRSV